MEVLCVIILKLTICLRQQAKTIQGHSVISQLSLENSYAFLWIMGGSRSSGRHPTQTRGEHANTAQAGQWSQTQDLGVRRHCCLCTFPLAKMFALKRS